MNVRTSIIALTSIALLVGAQCVPAQSGTSGTKATRQSTPAGQTDYGPDQSRGQLSAAEFAARHRASILDAIAQDLQISLQPEDLVQFLQRNNYPFAQPRWFESQRRSAAAIAGAMEMLLDGEPDAVVQAWYWDQFDFPEEDMADKELLESQWRSLVNQLDFDAGVESVRKQAELSDQEQLEALARDEGTLRLATSERIAYTICKESDEVRERERTGELDPDWQPGMSWPDDLRGRCSALATDWILERADSMLPPDAGPAPTGWKNHLPVVRTEMSFRAFAEQTADEPDEP